MGRPNCRRCLAYSTARSVVHAAAPDLERGGEHGPVPAPPRGDVGPGHRLARPAGRDRPHRGERVHRALQPGGVEGGGARPTRSPGRTGPAARRGRRGHSTRTGEDAVLGPAPGRRPRPGPPPPNRRRPRRRGRRPGGRPPAGPGTRARPSSSKTRTASARPSPTPPASSARQRLNTPASPSSLPAARSTTRSAPSRARIAVEGEPALAQPAHALGQVGLGFGQFEVHVDLSRSRRSGPGRRSRRGLRPGRSDRLLGQPEDALADDVALDLGGAGGDGQRDPPQPVLDHGGRPAAGPSPSAGLEVVGGRARPGRAARARTRRACCGSRCRPA